ncbi:MAG: AraC family transcriptional regulator [Firmicutes bacterium]|nr:AraC family transcriptional regulator [Bacillota bacterium]
MAQNYIIYQENVQMPNQEIGINSFYYDCINAPTSGVFPLHWHKCMELIAVQSGWLEVEIERKAYLIDAGSVAVINPQQLHSCTRFDPHTTLYCLIIDMDIFRSRYVESLEEKFITPLMEGRITLPSRVCGNSELNNGIRTCSEIFTGHPDAYQLRLKALLFQMLFLLFTQCGEVRSIEQKKTPASLSRERVNTILQYVDEHYAERIKLDDLVEILHINKYYICKIFQQCIGKTFLDYVNLVRIQKAVDMIVSTNDSITAIAFATGFQDINYFSRIFKRTMGISPTELRKRHRGTTEA